MRASHCPKRTWGARHGTPMPSWRVEGLLVQAPSASEARALWKRHTGQRRLPAGSRPVRVEE